MHIFLRDRRACLDIEGQRFENAKIPFVVVNSEAEAKKWRSHKDVLSIDTDAGRWPLAKKTSVLRDQGARIGTLVFGAGHTQVIAGPCGIESETQISEAAAFVKEYGAHALRGGAFKPRTSPYAFQGHGLLGAQWMAQAAAKVSMPCVSELVDAADIEAMLPLVDAFQIGARNMQNYALLKAVGQSKKAVVLKRGFGSKVQEFLSSAEYLLAHGSENVVLCERGIRTFEESCRFMLDLNAITWLKEHTHLPVIVDPSHAAGVARRVGPLAKAALAAGADGLLIETHPHPAMALSDKEQALSREDFAALMVDLRRLGVALERPLA